MPPKDEYKNQDDKRLSAVIVAESFEPRFSVISSASLGEQEICNVPAIEHTLRWISRCDIAHIVIVVSERNASAYQKIEISWKGLFDSFTIVICQNAHSIGDALRDVEGRNVISGHFLMIPSPVSFCNSTFQSEITTFKQRFKKDRNAVMTLIYAETSYHPNYVAIDDKSKLIAFHSPCDPQKLDTQDSEEDFKENVKVLKNVVDTGISIFSLQALAHFTDNFDFQTRDEVIRHILVNEEIMGQCVHVEILSSNETAISIYDYDGLIRSNDQFICRWFFPLVPINKNNSIHIRNGNVLTEGNERVSLKGWNCFIGKDVSLCKEKEALIISSTVANGCSIGKGVRIVYSIISNDCVIGDNVSLDRVFISQCVIISNGIDLPPQTIIGPNVKLSSNITIPSNSFISCTQPNEDIDDLVVSKELSKGIYAWIPKNGSNWWNGSWIGIDDEDNDDNKNDENMNKEEGNDDEDEDEEYDDDKVFYDEVYDSMKANLNDNKISPENMKKLIVEINSSKIAYNITMDKVASLVFIAFLRLPNNDTFDKIKKRVQNYIGLFRNYYKDEDAQCSLLKGLNEHLSSNRESFSPLVAKIIHYLYELDILSEESILEWNSRLDDEDPIKGLVKKIIDWLEESDDDDEEE